MSPHTRERSQAKRWLQTAGGSLDGIVAKRLDGRYEADKRAMLKVKCKRTADCVVGGFRYEQGTRQVDSLLLVYNETGELDHVGFTSSFTGQERAVLTEKLPGAYLAPRCGRSPLVVAFSPHGGRDYRREARTFGLRSARFEGS